MSEDIPEYATPPIKGYRILTEEDVVEINKLKELEAAVLSAVARLVERRSNDGRWISIGRTHIEEGFMALNRSIAKPDALPLFKIPPLSEASVA